MKRAFRAFRGSGKTKDKEQKSVPYYSLVRAKINFKASGHRGQEPLFVFLNVISVINLGSPRFQYCPFAWYIEFVFFLVQILNMVGQDPHNRRLPVLHGLWRYDAASHGPVRRFDKLLRQLYCYTE